MNNFATQMIWRPSVEIPTWGVSMTARDTTMWKHLSVKMTMSSALPTVFDATKNVIEMGGHADASWIQDFDLDPDCSFAQVSQNTSTITNAMQQKWHDPSEAVYFHVSCGPILVSQGLEDLLDISERNVEHSVDVPVSDTLEVSVS